MMIAPIGEGLIDHEKTVRALKEIEYDRTVTLEVFTNIDDVKSSTEASPNFMFKSGKILADLTFTIV
jgi:sugar phosphate isomerase/epimerase